MSDPIFLIKSEDLDKVKAYAPKLVGEAYVNYNLKGVILTPALDSAKQPVFYLNPIYKSDIVSERDIIIQINDSKACPFPPGYQ